jgi:hypothetical protein
MARLSAGPRKAPARMRMSGLQTPRTVRPHDRLEGHVPIAAALELRRVRRAPGLSLTGFGGPVREYRCPGDPSSNGHCVAMVAHTGALRRTFETPHDPSPSSVSRTRGMVGLVDVHDHRRSGSLQLGHLRTLERLVLWSTPPPRCPSTGIGRRRRRIRRLHERISPPTRKNNATNDFQRKISISNSLSYSGTHATNIGRSARFRAALKRVYR